MRYRELVALGLAFFLTTAQTSSADAVFWQAFDLETGANGTKDIPGATRLYQQGARQGHGPFMVRLGYMKQLGTGMPRTCGALLPCTSNRRRRALWKGSSCTPSAMSRARHPEEPGDGARSPARPGGPGPSVRPVPARLHDGDRRGRTEAGSRGATPAGQGRVRSGITRWPHGRPNIGTRSTRTCSPRTARASRTWASRPSSSWA